MRCAIITDGLGLLGGRVLVLPERFRSKQLALGRQSFPQLRWSRYLGYVRHA